MGHSEHDEEAPHLHYKKKLHALRIELLKLQSHVIRKDLRILVLFEGRDAAVKDGVINSLLSGVDYKGKNADLLKADPEVLIRFGPDPVEEMLAS